MDADETAPRNPGARTPDQPAHSLRPRTRPARVAAAVGLAAGAAAIALGTAALIRTPPPSQPAAQQTLREITVPPSPVIPLSDTEILALLDRSPDYGSPLDDRQRLTSCLRGLDYPASTPILGARPVHIDDRRAVLLLLPGDEQDTVIALAVAPTCSSVDTGLLATTTVRRP